MSTTPSSPDIEKNGERVSLEEKKHEHGATVSTREVDSGAALIAGEHIVLDEAEALRIRYVFFWIFFLFNGMEERPDDDAGRQEEDRLAHPPVDDGPVLDPVYGQDDAGVVSYSWD
jgi:hypothetical protein